jgi:hypothetical protein
MFTYDFEKYNLNIGEILIDSLHLFQYDYDFRVERET